MQRVKAITKKTMHTARNATPNGNGSDRFGGGGDGAFTAWWVREGRSAAGGAMVRNSTMSRGN